MMKKSILIALMALLTLTGCSALTVPKLLQIQSAPVEKHQLKVPNVDRYDARPLEWIVLTPDNVEEVFAKLKDSKTDLVLFAVTDDGYQNLSLNMADVIKLVKQQKSIIAAYEKYLENEEAQ